MTRDASPGPPLDLSAGARRLWRLVHAKWVVDDARRAVLTVTLRAEDRAAAARQLIKTEGLIVAAGKSTRAHPAVAVLKDAELIALKGWRQLALEGAPAGVPGRPAGAV